MKLGRSHLANGWTKSRRAALVVAVVAGLTLALVGPASAVITPTATALTIAQSIASSSVNVTAASFAAVPPNGTPNGVSTSVLTGFPTDGASYGILTTGDVSSVDQPGTFADTADGGLPVRGDTDLDVSILKIDLSIPSGINCLSFDFRFFSEEFPVYVGTQFNDAFVAELDTSTWTTSGSTITAPNNFAFDSSNNVVSINSTGLGGMTPARGTGTAYDGTTSVPDGDPNGAATVLLSASTPVTPGPHSVYLSLFDQADQAYDSAVFLDNLRSGFVSNPGQNCEPGASEPARLTLIKTVNNSGGGTAVPTDWTLSATGPTSISGQTGDAAITNATVTPGTYTLSEDGPTGYNASAWGCTGGTLTGNSLVLAAGQTAICTINNTFATSGQAQLTLVKTVDNTGGGTAAPTDWILSATGPTTISGRSGDASITNATVSPGTYALAEANGPSGYTASAWNCTGGTLTGSSLVLAAAQTAICTINNTFVPSSDTIYVSIALDRSGSMKKGQTITNYNAWVAQAQTVVPEARATQARFNSCGYVQKGPSGMPISNLQVLTKANYNPSCRTPLYDAIAKTINRAAANPLSAGDVVIVIYSDGRENASKNWTSQELNALIAGKVAEGWTFVWLGGSTDPLFLSWAAKAAELPGL